MALLAGAAAFHAFNLDVSDAIARGASVLLALAGMLSALQAWVGWMRTERALRESKPLPANVSRVVLAVAVVASAAVLVAASLWR